VATHQQTIRRGLPRRPGGPAWPDVISAEAGPAEAGPAASEHESAVPVSAPAAAVPSAGDRAATTVTEEVTLRRGLPRVAGGEPWPTVTTATVQRVAGPDPGPVASGPVVSEAVADETPAPAIEAPRSATKPASAGTGVAAQRVRRGALGLAGIVVAAGIIVLAARGVTTLQGVPEFLARYPGTYDLPESAPVGFPVWLNVVHYLNFFFLVLIVRSGLEVRYQKKPPAYWTSRRGDKVSLAVWLHTSLDLLWLLNGLVFVVLLFVTGQWMRIVPTSWEVFPNAASAALQYLTLDWPVEDGWVHFNGLQQLTYFLVVFVAAPLAAITGVRMSGWWPKKATRLNRVYPAALARAVHFPTMLFFVLFVIGHVTLVFSTGALRNLNHMYAAQDTTSWVGFAWFAGGLALAVAAALAVRPLVVAPVASIFGKVSSR
jgi:thiosulfate reductase cytochrome b subunit